MSNTINFRFYKNGNLKGVNRRLIINCFNPYIQPTKNGLFWKIVFESQEQCDVIIDEEPLVDNFVIHKPSGSELLAKVILKIADLGYLFSLESGLESIVIYSKKSIDHFPNELKKDFWKMADL